MSTSSLDLPYPPDDDVRQAQRDRQEAQIRQALNWHLIRQDVLERLALAWLEGEGRLGVIVDQLTDAPIRDRWDLDGYLRHCAGRDAEALGRQLMRLVAETVLAHVEARRDEQPI